MSTALDYKRQVYQNRPKKAYEKAQRVYGKRMQDAPKKVNESTKVTTDFTALLELRKSNAQRKERANSRFMAFLGFSLITFLIVFLLTTIGRLA